MSSMFSNINAQVKEIGILRVLGISKGWVYRMYILEAVIIILSASCLGIIIGVVVGYTMRISRSLFLQLPIPFVFPWELVLTVFLTSILCGFLSSWKPTRSFLEKIVLKPLTFLDFSPRFSMTKYPSSSQDALVSFPTFVMLSGGAIESVEDIPMDICLLQFKDGITDDEINEIESQVGAVIASHQDSTARIWDYRRAIANSQIANTVLSYFFIFAIVIAMIICFFSLMSSMFSNINAQVKEIGILRILGISKEWIYRMYILEAVIIILSSSCLGIIIGVVVGYTMRISRSLFLQLPIPFVFPCELVLTVFLTSILCGFLSSWRPTRTLLNKKLVELLK